MSLSPSPSDTKTRTATALSQLLRTTDPAHTLLPVLRERGFVAAPDSAIEYAGGHRITQLDRAAAVAHLDARHPSTTAAVAGARMGMYVSDCLINTEAEPPYLRLPSFPSHNPYLIAYLLGFPPGETRQVLVDLQVFSTGGSIRVTATGNPTAVTVGHTSFPIAVPISLTTTADGFASVFIQRNGETGFDWYAVDVF